MRLILATMLSTAALPLGAETILATSQITDVTVYPDGAKITRKVVFTAPGPGSHELLVTDLPQATEPGLLRLNGAEGMVFGAFSLRADRLPPREEPLSPAQTAAQATLDAALAAERKALAAVEAVQARIQAAEARARFLTSFTGALPDSATPESLKAMADVVGSETLLAAQSIATAQADLWQVNEALTEAQEASQSARDSYAALPSRDSAYTALSVALEAAAAGDSEMTVTHYISNAGWRPYYDLYLSRADSAKLSMDRAVLVTQHSGEDWSGVALTLSSSRPSEQAAPSQLWPWLRQIVKDEPVPQSGMLRQPVVAAEMADAALAPAPMNKSHTAAMAMQGDTVVYHYPRAVDIASGVEDLRLGLDRLELAPQILAVAVPSRDKTAFVMAEFTNQTAEPILPGEALLFREGVLVGSTQIGGIAPGAQSEIAFGPIDTLQLSREMPARDSGQTGLFTTSNQWVEAAVLKIKNTGSQSWPLRVIDQIPYSEQKDLVVTPSLSPRPSSEDLDGERGVMAWELELAPGAEQVITSGYQLSWPEGMILR